MTSTGVIPRFTVNWCTRSVGCVSGGSGSSGMLTLTATPMPQSVPRPMLASLDAAPLVDPRFAYEPKYDGIRALAMVRAGGGPGAVRLWSRLGNDKTGQFPEIVRALASFARKLKADVLLDGEIVALDQHGEPAGFQRLQGRIHLTSERDIGGRVGTEPVAFVAFDVLRDGETDVRALPLTARRARLERIFGNTGTTLLRLSEFSPGDGRALYHEVLARGWEGLVAKELDSPYMTGRRSPAWRKIKVLRRQECVVGGFTEGRGSRAHFGALWLGLRDDVDVKRVRRETTGSDAVGRGRPRNGPPHPPAAARRRTARKRDTREVEPWPRAGGAAGRLISTLAEVETRGGDAVVDLPGDSALAVS